MLVLKVLVTCVFFSFSDQDKVLQPTVYGRRCLSECKASKKIANDPNSMYYFCDTTPWEMEVDGTSQNLNLTDGSTINVKSRTQVFDWDVCSGYSKTCRNGADKCSNYYNSH